jgi:hypothetical protein
MHSLVRDNRLESDIGTRKNGLFYKNRNSTGSLAAKEYMRTIQLLGLISALVAFMFLYWALSPLTPDSSSSSEGAAGLVLMFIVPPVIGFSAFLLIPSSIALLNSKLRENTYFKGKFWCSVWAVNSLLSICYIIVAAYIGYIYLTSVIGN